MLDKKKPTLDEHTLLNVTQIFKALGDSTRVRILYLLKEHEYSVNEIAQTLNLTQSNASHQLRLLKNLRLVKARRDGTTIYYSQDDAHVMNLLEQAIHHTQH